MTTIDFYVLDSSVARSREQFACRLAEKAYSKGVGVYLHVADETAASNLDEMLWTFRDGSFLPHARVESKTAADSPIIVGCNPPSGESTKEMLINLAEEVPAFYGSFTRVAEVAGPAEPDRKRAREHFRIYRKNGIEPTTHDMTGK